MVTAKNHTHGAIKMDKKVQKPGNSRKLLDRVRDEIRIRHYSIKTEQAYTEWVKKYVRFHGMRHPEDMGAEEIK